MRESLNEPVSVIYYYNARNRRVQPYQLTWNNKDYRLGQVDFWHKTKIGDVLIHHFSLADINGHAYFKLALDTRSLAWTLEEFMSAADMAVKYRRSV